MRTNQLLQPIAVTQNDEPVVYLRDCIKHFYDTIQPKLPAEIRTAFVLLFDKMDERNPASVDLTFQLLRTVMGEGEADVENAETS